VTGRPAILMAAAALLAALVAALLAAGCSGGKSKSADVWLKEKLFPPSTAERVAMVESDLADQRREALEKVAADPAARQLESVVKLFCLVATTDADPMVRAAAARGLAVMEGPNVIESLAKVVTADKDPYVRCDAVEAMGRQAKPEGAAALVTALESDTSAYVRIASAEALRRFRDKTAAEALARAVETRDIAVARKAWESLRYMTGQDLPRESQPWTEFLASGEDPSAAYGKAPTMPKGQNQRPHFTRGIGSFLKGLFAKDVREAELE